MNIAEFIERQAQLTDDEFMREIAQTTAAIAIDLQSGRITNATPQAETLFRCHIKNGLIGRNFEELIPEEFRQQHKWHVAKYSQAPKPRAMGDYQMRLMALPLEGDPFPVAIELSPIQKHERLFIILRFSALPTG